MLTPHDPRDLARRVAELERRVSNVLRYGTIHDVEGWRVRVAWGVQSGGEPALSAWVPWLTTRAGAALTWSPPSIGERCLLLSPEGDMRMGVAALAIYTVPPHDLPPQGAGGTGAVTIVGDLIVTGRVAAEGAVTGTRITARSLTGDVDLQTHVHGLPGTPPVPGLSASVAEMGRGWASDVRDQLDERLDEGRARDARSGGSDPPGDDPGEGGA